MTNLATAAQRTFVLIDSQNMYKGARRAFFAESAPSRHGQYDPQSLAELLVSRHPNGRVRTLAETCIYTGRPSAAANPKGNSANTRQCQAWEARGVTVHWRPLQYINGRPPSEKGIDIAIAVDLMKAATSGHFDVAIACSADSDLAPAIEVVMDGYGGGTMKVEVAGWREGNYGQRIWVPGRDLGINWLCRNNYDAVQDHTDYSPH